MQRPLSESVTRIEFKNELYLNIQGKQCSLSIYSFSYQCPLWHFLLHCALPWTSQVAQVVKNTPVNAGDVRDAGLISGLRRSPGEGNGNPLQYSCLENPVDRILVGYSPWGCRELDTTETTWYAAAGALL